MTINGIVSGMSSAVSSGLSTSAASDVVKSVVDQTRASLEAQKGQSGYLGGFRLDKIEKKVSDAMSGWIKSHPNATEAEIQAESSKQAKKETSIQTFDKMASDNFFSNLMKRRKELLSDMWG